MKTAELPQPRCFSILFVFLLLYGDLRRERKDVGILIIIQQVNRVVLLQNRGNVLQTVTVLQRILVSLVLMMGLSAFFLYSGIALSDEEAALPF